MTTADENFAARRYTASTIETLAGRGPRFELNMNLVSEGTATLPGRRALAVTYRTANLNDIPAMTATLEGAGLPARLIEPFIDTFIVAETDGVIVACGGIEVHDDTAVLRSVAVDDSLRGSGVGHNLSDLLVDLAASLQVVDIYLFTGDAWSFWQKQGFTTIDLEDWREPARACWQFEYVRKHRRWAESVGLRTMWMPAPEVATGGSIGLRRSPR